MLYKKSYEIFVTSLSYGSRFCHRIKKQKVYVRNSEFISCNSDFFSLNCEIKSHNYCNSVVETCIHKVRVIRILRGAAVFSVSNELVIFYFYFPLMYIWTLYVYLSFYFSKKYCTPINYISQRSLWLLTM